MRAAAVAAGRPAPGAARPAPVRWAAPRELRPTYDAVIAGAGVQGLALAYELTKRRFGRIAVLDAGWPGCGASGANGEMIRSAFGSPEWDRFFQHSLCRWQVLSAELRFNVLFTRAGYLILALDDDELPDMRVNTLRHPHHGIRSRLLDAERARRLIPAAAPEVVRGGVYQADAGFAHHDAVVWAYGRAAARLGVEVHPFTPVSAVAVDGGRVRGVETGRGRISTPVVVDAAGAGAPAVARLAGVDLPLSSCRLEMLVTESVTPFLRPAVSVPGLRAYCHQTSRGEFVGGTELPRADVTDRRGVTWSMLVDMARTFTTLFPCLAGLRVLRHWSGLVSQTPDLSPILGPVAGIDGFFLDCGWVYGFMGAPAAGDLLAEAIASGRPADVLKPFLLDRFSSGRLIREGSLVVTAETGP